MRPVRSFTMLGQRWRYLVVGHLGFQKDKKGTEWYNGGHTDPPGKPNRAIKILQRLQGKERLETIIHEAGGHAADFKWSEDYVEEWAHDLAELLWRLGYRAPGD